MEYDDNFFTYLFNTFKQTLVDLDKYSLPSVSQIALKYDADPYLILVATLISLRTKDSVTLSSSVRLFERAKTPKEILALTDEELESLIYPCAFYKRKAQNIKTISKILLEEHNGQVPDTEEELMRLPGVGIKSANLTLNLGFNIDAICVDCHVHQICNRLGIIDTKTPEESEKELKKVMPKRFWIPLNELFVTYGMEVCTPLSPKCSLCPFNNSCNKVGVKVFR